MARRTRLALLMLPLVVAACSSASISVDEVPPLPATTPEDIEALVADSDIPVVVNVWASWCAPCRSEAPLLRTAAAQYDGAVLFVGVNVRDEQSAARAFIAEFGLEHIDHYFDTRGAVPLAWGGTGVPITFFFAPGGELVATHLGVIDEPALAIKIDELLTSR
jgi:cytochrome c biogenesis protein CcmG/thiol:disulfide interchange protein DsbE